MIPFARILSYGNKVAGLSKIKDLQANDTHLMLLTTDGDMWAYGYSNSGSMGIGTTVPQANQGWYKSNISNVRLFSSNRLTSTIAVTTDNKVYVCGSIVAAKFSTPNLPTSNLSWLDVTDHIPQEILDAGIKQIYNQTNYVAILTNNNVVYSVAFTLGDSSVVVERTWRRNTATSIVPDKIVGFEQTASGFVFIVQDSSGYLYGLGYNGNRIISSAATSTFTTYTQLGTLAYLDYQIANGGTFSTGILSDGRAVHCGSLTGVASFNNTLTAASNVPLKVAAFAGCGIGVIQSNRMLGAYTSNQLPIASAGNTNSGSVVIIRNMPGSMSSADIKFMCGNGSTSTGNKNMYVLYQDVNGKSTIFGLGFCVGQGASVNQPFVKIDLPGGLE
jgi:hypothetical protein